MNQIFFILFLYILFGVIGPIIKRMQQAQRTSPRTPVPQRPQQTPQQKVEANVEKYFTRLQEAFQQPAELPPARQEAQSPLFSIPARPTPPEKTDSELFPPPLPAAPRVSPPSRPSPARRKSAPPVPQHASLLGFDRRRGYIQGILMAEILGPPVSQRPKR